MTSSNTFAVAHSKSEDSETAVLEIAEQLNGRAQETSLAVVFASPHHLANLDSVHTSLRSHLNPNHMMGSSGVAIVTNGEEVEDDLEFISKARTALSEGKQVFYDSWW